MESQEIHTALAVLVTNDATKEKNFQDLAAIHRFQQLTHDKLEEVRKLPMEQQAAIYQNAIDYMLGRTNTLIKF